jgi:hypothetical protein
MFNGSFRLIILSALLAGPAGARTWTDRLGRTFEAGFVRVDGANIILTQPGGRAYAMPLTDLSAQDQASLQGGGLARPVEITAANFGRPWPREIRLDGPVICKTVSEDAKAGRYVYESPGYRFTCDARVTDDALRNFSVMFESTLKYAKSVPLGLAGRERNGKLDVLLFGSMREYVRSGGPPNSAGCFTRGVVLVPMESLGLKEGGTGFSLDTKRDNKVLIHELIHQLTPGAYMQPGALGWFSEGLAESMAITPYNWGYFSPDIYGNAVKTYVTGFGEGGSGGRGLGTRIAAPKLREFFLMPYGAFSGSNGNFNYGMGLLLTHYFLHMDGGGKAIRITEVLKLLQAGQRGETALAPLLGGGTYEKLEGEIAAAWARMGVEIRFGG